MELLMKAAIWSPHGRDEQESESNAVSDGNKDRPFWRRHPVLASCATALPVYVAFLAFPGSVGMLGFALAIVLGGIALRTWWWALIAPFPYLALAGLGMIGSFIAMDPLFTGFALVFGVLFGVPAAACALFGVGFGLAARALLSRARPTAILPA